MATLSKLNKEVEQATGKKLTLDDLLKKQDPKTWKQALRRSTSKLGGV